MARSVFLHVGTPKTGTTYLQRLLWANKPILADRGLLMPGRDRDDSLFAMMEIREQRDTLTRHGDRATRAWQSLRDEIERWNGDALISHELLSAASSDQADRAIRSLAPARVHVVLTTRDFVPLVPALWQESVKIGTPSPLADYCAAMLDGYDEGVWSWRTADPVAVLDRWARTLPAQDVHVVTVPPGRSEPTLLWERFACALGLDPAGVTQPGGRDNQSLGRAQAELLHRLDTRWPEPIGDDKRERHRWVRAFLGQDLLADQSGTRITVPPAAASRLRARAERAAGELAARGYHICGDLDDLTAASLPTSEAPPVDDSELLDVAMTTITHLVLAYREQTLALGRARRRWTRSVSGASRPQGGLRARAGLLLRRRRRVGAAG